MSKPQFTSEWLEQYEQRHRKPVHSDRRQEPSVNVAPEPQKAQDRPNHPIVERDFGNGDVRAARIQGRDTRRYLVLIESRRSVLIDEDNACEKYAIDALRYAGVIPGDEPQATKIEWFQTQVEQSQEETVIEIFPPQR